VLHRPDEASPHMLNVFHVYVVVDNPVVCKSLQRLLEMGNFRCHCFPSVTKLNWPPFRPDTRHNLEGLRLSSSTGLCLTTTNVSN
jgi:hypothetical protein